MLKRLFVAAVAALAFAQPSMGANNTSAPIPLTDSAWTDLGACPISVQIWTRSTGAAFLIDAPSTPGSSDTGFILGGTYPSSKDLACKDHLWARAITAAGASVVTSPYIAPSGGGGGGGSVTQGTTPWAVSWSGQTVGVSNWPSSWAITATSLPLPTGAAQETGGNLATIAGAQGVDNSGVSQPASGSGIRGWLSAIYQKVAGTISVSWSGQSVAVTGATSNAADAVTTGSTGVPTIAYLFGFNGTTYDRLRVDGNKNLLVGASASSYVDGWDATQGLKADSAYAGSGSASVISILKGLYNALVAATPPGEQHIGEIGYNVVPLKATMATTASGAYTTGKSLGGKQTLTGAARVSGTAGNSGTSGEIVNAAVTINNPSLTGAAADIYLFDADPSGSTCTDNTTFALVDADRQKVIGIIQIGSFTSSNTAVIGQNPFVSLFYSLSSSTSIYACVVLRDSFTLPAGTSNGGIVLKARRN